MKKIPIPRPLHPEWGKVRSRGNSRRALSSGAIALFLFSFPGLNHGAETAPAVNEQMPGLTEQDGFPTKKLRIYGEVTGKYWISSTGGSLLEIICQDAEHARLLQAKYLSDLAELPPATQPGQITVGSATITIQSAPDVGVVAALRKGNTVILATAKDANGMTQLLTAGLVGDPVMWTSVAEGKVPMYLDRFDKYGFRFYYAPGNLKPGPDGRSDPLYDSSEDFDFAQATHGGILVWSTGYPSETAEGLNNDALWSWSLSEAKERGLAFGLNLGISGSATWNYNRHPESLMQSPPGFLGTYYGSMNYGIANIVSWTSADGTDAMLGQIQNTVRQYKDTENITSWLEPHEELGGGPADLFVEAGPLSDANYQAYLRGKYQTVQALSQRWYGNPTTLNTWDMVRAPELADFLGWGPDAVDLAGEWRVDYGSADDPTALATDFDDSTWGKIVTPGHGLARMLPPKPALWRRHFRIDGGWLAKHPKVWLYVWDMNDTRAAKADPKAAVVISLNGTTVPEDPPVYLQSHWAALDVTTALHDGDNVLAVRLPRGVFNYRVYLSGDEPKSYPELGPGLNAQWVDFSEWVENLRMSGVRRGMQMIRQEDPDRGIMLMAPDSYADAIQQDALEYGGDFHNTGYMAGWWCDKLPALMRGVGLPISAEPGNGPTLPIHVLTAFGNWFSEGCNGIDYFQNLGEVLWHPDVKKCFEDHAAMYTSIGRFHAPVAQIAALYSNRTNDLYGFPWNARPASDNGQPYFRSGSYPSAFNGRDLYSPVENVPAESAYDSDAVTEMNLQRDQAGKYRVVVDSNTSVMDPATLAGIERFVRAGGIFVTWGESGRHSPETPNSWPIAALSGFNVPDITPYQGTVQLAQGQTVFPPDFSPSDKVSGLKLTPTASDAQTIMTWDDGSTAVGLRPLGKGFIVTTGPWFNHLVGHDYLTRLFQWQKIAAIPAHLEANGKDIYWRHFLSNNGLYDIWVFRNYNSTQPAEGTLVLDDGLNPGWAVDLNSATRTPVTGGRLPINLPPADMAISITPRAAVADSAANWFDLQRGWWQGTADPGPAVPPLEMKLISDLSADWAFQPVDAGQTDVSALVAPTTTDESWTKLPLGIFTLPDHRDVRHAVVRKHFQVPAGWNDGRVLLRLPEFREHSNVYLDGAPLVGEPTLAAGSDHVLAVEIQSRGVFLGAKGPAWLTYHPKPEATQSLASNWSTSSDLLNWTGTADIPGQIAQGVRTLRATVKMDPAAAGKTVVLHVMQNSREISGAIINGNYVRPWVREGAELNLNITPWIHPGQDNEIILLDGGSLETISDLSLEFHKPGSFP